MLRRGHDDGLLEHVRVRRDQIDVAGHAQDHANVKTEPQGPHGSGINHILAGTFDGTTGATGTSAHVCFKCHLYAEYVNDGADPAAELVRMLAVRRYKHLANAPVQRVPHLFNEPPSFNYSIKVEKVHRENAGGSPFTGRVSSD